MLPLIKWSGGKRDEIARIQPHIPEFKRYIEPFVGGGALYFHLNHPNSVISDVHQDLVALYSQIKEGHAEDIYNFMKAHPNTEEEYYNIRDRFTPSNDLERACKFFYERKTCYRGMLRYNKKGQFNIPYGRYKTYSFEELLDKKYSTLLGSTDVRLAGFEEIFAEFDDPDNFMFLDPPYDSEFTDYGYCQFGRDQQVKLAECFKKSKNKCLMVIGKTDFICELYKDYIAEEYDKKYAFKLHSGRIGNEINNKHLVIKNY